MSISGSLRAIILVLVSLLLVSTVACSGDSSNTNNDEATITPKTDGQKDDIPDEDVVITIGNYTDITGPASNPMSMITMALEDIVKYYNDENVIPGVELEVVSYDSQYDPSNDIPGYEWLREKGADLIFNAIPSASITMKSRVDEDHMMFFALTPDEKSLVPAGYVFCISNTLGDYQSYTLLKWLAENDENFPQDRPAKVGGAFWAEPYSQTFLDGMEEYVDAHPDQYEWEGEYLTNFAFTWGPEVDALKDCDYVMPPGPMQNFIREYRGAGYDAQLIGTDFQIAMLEMVDALDVWDEADGMIIIRPGQWWNEDGELISLAKELLNENHPDDAEYVKSTGPGYQTMRGMYIMLEILRETIETTGTENFSSEALYEAAQSYSLILDDVQMHSFTDTKRTSLDHMGIYRLDGAEQDLFRLVPEWIPVVYEP